MSNPQTLSFSNEVPIQFEMFLSHKLNQVNGRPNFLRILKQRQIDVKDAILTIVEDAWIKDRPLGNIAHDYKTKYHTIFRLLKELEFLRKPLTAYLLSSPRRKRFYMPELDQSDYQTVQDYIRHAHSSELKKWKETVHDGERMWKALGYKDPSKWNQEEVDQFLTTFSDRPGAQYGFVVAVRALCPQLHKTMKRGPYLEKLKRHKPDIFVNEINMIHKALKPYPYEQLIFDLHITIGAREGKRGEMSGMCGLTWDRFKHSFSVVDDFESKVRKGIWWRDCPVDLFFRNLPRRIKRLWIERGRPSNDVILKGAYGELLDVYRTIRTVLSERYSGKVEPSLLKELVTIRPHAADKIHVNLLWEAGTPLEVVAGEYLGQGEGVGLVGRGWLTIDVVKKYYLSLTRRSRRFRKVRRRIRAYSNLFALNRRRA